MTTLVACLALLLAITVAHHCGYQRGWRAQTRARKARAQTNPSAVAALAPRPLPASCRDHADAPRPAPYRRTAPLRRWRHVRH